VTEIFEYDGIIGLSYSAEEGKRKDNYSLFYNIIQNGFISPIYSYIVKKGGRRGIGAALVEINFYLSGT